MIDTAGNYYPDNGGVDYEGRCLRCGRKTESTAGCNCRYDSPVELVLPLKDGWWEMPGRVEIDNGPGPFAGKVVTP